MVCWSSSVQTWCPGNTHRKQGWETPAIEPKCSCSWKSSGPALPSTSLPPETIINEPNSFMTSFEALVQVSGPSQNMCQDQFLQNSKYSLLAATVITPCRAPASSCTDPFTGFGFVLTIIGSQCSLVAKELLVVAYAAFIETSISRVLVHTEKIHTSTAECDLVLQNFDYGGIAWIRGVCLWNGKWGKVVFHVFCSHWLEGLQSSSERCYIVDPEEYEILGFLLKYISGYLRMLERPS